VLAGTLGGGVAAQEAQSATPQQPKQKAEPTQVAQGLDPKVAADISLLQLTPGDYSYRSDGTPVPVPGAVARGPNMTVPAGTVFDALRRGVESITIANDGKIPDGATFRLIVGIGAKPKQFTVDLSKIDPERKLQRSGILALQKEDSLREPLAFLQKNSVNNIHRQTSNEYFIQFALATDHKQPVQILLVMDQPKTNSVAEPEKK
jgi:hypothetical protein